MRRKRRPNKEKYTGGKDKEGRYHGRGTLLLVKDKVRFEGKFSHGVKSGKGRMFFPDGATIEGIWVDDEVQGEATYTNSDGSRIVGTWVEGVPSGMITEYDETGEIRFQGEYFEGTRHGNGKLYLVGGGWLEGNWDNGQLTDDSAIYHEPSPSNVTFRGKWMDGTMTEAYQYDSNGQRFQGEAAISLSEDEATTTMLCTHPTVPCVFELERVYVAPSTMPSANEGLFARIDIGKGEVCAFYNGIKISQKEVDDRGWALNDNCITLREGLVIDIPLHLASTTLYCASLGHKANHSFTANSMYDLLCHPRFGDIKCVRATVDIKKGEEIFVDYGYTDEKPLWYEQLEAKFLQSRDGGEMK